jgi:hypothetical protein
LVGWWPLQPPMNLRLATRTESDRPLDPLSAGQAGRQAGKGVGTVGGCHCKTQAGVCYACNHLLLPTSPSKHANPHQATWPTPHPHTHLLLSAVQVRMPPAAALCRVRAETPPTQTPVPLSPHAPAALCRASANASSCSLWFFSGLNCATLTRYRCFSLRSRGSFCRSDVSQGGYTRAGSFRDHHSCCMCADVQDELTITTSAAAAGSS